MNCFDNIVTEREQHYLPGFGGRGGLVLTGGRGVCGGNGGLGPSPPSPVKKIEKCTYAKCIGKTNHDLLFGTCVSRTIFPALLK